MTAGEAVLELAALWEQEADILEKRHADERAGLMRELAREARQVVESHLSPWVPLAEVCERTGYGPDTLRTRAHELKPQGLARKMNGSWHFERGAAARIRPKRNGRPVEPSEWSDIEAVAQRLAREN